jgi:GrpB-like predicted nucleotidyltransferase (UPF0157 family)
MKSQLLMNKKPGNFGKNCVNRIEVVHYNSEWPRIFEAEKEIISAALGDNCVAI